MKNIFYSTLLLMLPIISCSQTNYNELTLEQYHNISFNGVTLLNLLDFDGNISDLSNLIGIPFADVTHPQNDEGTDYDNPSISISYFEDELGSIHVKTFDIAVNINSIDIRVGDNISLLGYGNGSFNSFINPGNNNIRICIFKPEYNDTYISLRFNGQTGLIEDIRFVSPT